MTKKIIRLTPDQMGYQDRGKMKWQGLMLSDHTEAIRKSGCPEIDKDTPPKAKLPLNDIAEKIAYAYLKKLPIFLQTNILKNGTSFQEYYCLIAGHHDNKIYFSLKNGQLFKTALENIRYLELVDPVTWQMLE